MLTFVFGLFMFLIFGKIFLFALKAAWGITRIVCSVVLLPIVLVGLVVIGLIKLAVPILAIIGIITLLKLHD